MGSILYFTLLFAAKVLDNALSTTKTILIQRSRWLLAGITVVITDFIYLSIISRVITSSDPVGLFVVAIAGGVGCSVACLISDKLSKERIYVNIIMSDDIEAMKELRDFLAAYHITNVATDSYTLDWNKKAITITAYAETKDESRLINTYIDSRQTKFKHIVQKG